MGISDSKEIFTPTTDWMTEKYNELNAWLFGGNLGECDFEIYTSGKGSEGRSFGHFRFGGQNVKYRKSDRQMYKIIDSINFNVNRRNFYTYTKPIIGFNGNYKRTEHAWLNTLVHEMCHYYTYMDGMVPLQAHGTEFKNIAYYVSRKSNGIFNISRLTNDETAELSDEMKEKKNKRNNNMKSKMTALLIFMLSGEVRLVTSTSENLISSIIKDSNKLICRRLLASNDPNYIEYLWSKGFKNNMKAYRYWPVTGKDVVDDIKKYDYRTIMENDKIKENYSLDINDIKLMVESIIEKIMGERKDNEIGDITPDMILSDASPLEK